MTVDPAALGSEPGPVAAPRQGTEPLGDGPEVRRLETLASAAWAAFARTGDPSTAELPWPAYDTMRRATVAFDVETRVYDDYQTPVRQILEEGDGSTRPAQLDAVDRIGWLNPPSSGRLGISVMGAIRASGTDVETGDRCRSPQT